MTIKKGNGSAALRLAVVGFLLAAFAGGVMKMIAPLMHVSIALF